MSAEHRELIAENKRRRAALFAPYNPVTGEGSPIERVEVRYFAEGKQWKYWVPVQMYKEMYGVINMLNTEGSIEAVLRLNNTPVNHDTVKGFMKGLAENRFNYDFEYWAYTTVKIQDKISKKLVPFKLNKGQRKLLASFEKQRVSGKPIRVILDKARQWGNQR